jgi:hypothetical protein
MYRYNTPEHGIVILHIVVVQQRVHLQTSPIQQQQQQHVSISSTSVDN